MTSTSDGETRAAQEGQPGSPALGGVAARGARVLVVGQLARVVVQMLAVVVLARLLTPTDYGMFALVLAVVAIGEVFRDFGLSTAAIQARSLSHAQQSNLLWINVGAGAVLAALCFLVAPVIAAVTGEPDAEGLARVMALAFLLNGAIAQYRADLNRRLRFRALVVGDVGGVAVGVVAGILSALGGLGHWALAVQQLVGLGTTVLLCLVLAGWLPARPNREGDVRPFLRFGVGMVGTQLVGYFNNNVDTLTIGLRMGPVELGIYNRAYQLLMQTLNQFRNPTTTVALPVLSRLEPGTASADQALLRGQAALGYTLVAGTAFAAGAADPIVRLALGEGWERSIPLFAALAAAGAFQTMGFSAYWIFVSRGLTGRLFGNSLLSLLTRVVGVLVGSTWGVLGVAVGYALAPMVMVPVTYLLAARWTPLPTRSLLAAAARIMACAALAAVTTRVAAELMHAVPSPVALLGCLAVTVATYAAAAAVPAVRRDVLGVVAFGRAAFNR